MFPSGSLNQATFAPVGVVQTPSSSCMKCVALETNPGLYQVLYRGGNIRNLPAQHRALDRWTLLAHAEPQHDAVGVEHQRERRLFAQQTQAERVTVELLRTRDIDDGHESNDVVFSKP